MLVLLIYTREYRQYDLVGNSSYMHNKLRHPFPYKSVVF